MRFRIEVLDCERYEAGDLLKHAMEAWDRLADVVLEAGPPYELDQWYDWPWQRTIYTGNVPYCSAACEATNLLIAIVNGAHRE